MASKLEEARVKLEEQKAIYDGKIKMMEEQQEEKEREAAERLRQRERDWMAKK